MGNSTQASSQLLWTLGTVLFFSKNHQGASQGAKKFKALSVLFTLFPSHGLCFLFCPVYPCQLQELGIGGLGGSAQSRVGSEQTRASGFWPTPPPSRVCLGKSINSIIHQVTV